MAKSIITQSGDVVNYANISAIYSDSAIEDDEDGNEYVAHCLYAETISEIMYVLGEFDSEEEAVNARNKLVNWLNSEAFGVYSMTEGAE
jgi:hypothetical protein